ncbi:MAG: 4-hydroxy-tetrahydrodipicolinate synthase [Flavobacteriaceae bacterium TMED212]|nr:MAG: 4-hydroxy-tetrahydrodipicolinate synthase [Flavobacteriaceae bacterium TMED212]|tara:strand:- start:30495 stop:31394 length:900 start_codon:yes stop_codon:yes gene_type:complete
MKTINGHGVAIITPFKKNGEIDFNAIPHIIEHLISGGVDFFVVLGTTAETATLTKEEKINLVGEVVHFNAGRLPIVLGLGGNDTQQTLDMFDWFNLKPFSAILSVSPYYNKPNQEGLYQHFKRIASHSSLPLILYNVPSRTGVNIAPETVLRLANDFENIIALKEASGDFQQAQTLIKLCPPGFSILSGDDEMSLPIILAGAKGVISVIGNAIPKIYSKLIKLGLVKDVDKAYTYQYKILDLIRMIYDEGNPTGIKVLMDALGLCENNLRLPLVAASKELTLRLKNELKNVLTVQNSIH